MIQKLSQNQLARVKTAFLSFDQKQSSKFFYYLTLLTLPLQAGKHFWPSYSFVDGLRIDYLSPTLYVSDIGILIFIILSALLYRNTIKVFILKHKLYLLLAACFIFLNITFANNSSLTFFWWLKLGEFTSFSFFIALGLRSRNISLKKSIFILAASACLVAVLAIFQFINQGSLGGVLYFLGERAFSSSTPGIANASINNVLVLRPYATFPHPNVLAGFLLTVSLLLIGLFANMKKNYSRKSESYLLSVALILPTISLFLTLSRAAIATFSLLSVAIFIKWFALKPSLLSISTWLVFTLVALSLFLSYSGRWTGNILTERSLHERISLNHAAFNIGLNSPLTGTGLGGFIPALAEEDSGKKLPLQPVHNIYLLTFSEAGIIGIGILILGLWNTIKIMIKKSNSSVILVSLPLISLLIIGLIDHYIYTLQQGRMLLAILLGFLYGRRSP